MNCEELIIRIVVDIIIVGLFGLVLNILFFNYQKKKSQQEQAAKLAELFAKWNSISGIKNKELRAKAREELTRLSFEIAIWVPDEALVEDVMKRLANKPDAKDAQELVLDSRRIILGGKVKQLKKEDITYFPPEN